MLFIELTLVSLKRNTFPVCVSGGCKHAIALAAWVHRRSEEPSPTEVKCYWKRGRLSSVGLSIKFVTARELNQRNNDQGPQDVGSNFLNEVVALCRQEDDLDCILLNQFTPCASNLSMHKLIIEFCTCDKKTSDQFLSFLTHKLMTEDLDQIFIDTLNQYLDPLWIELHYCRISASKLFEAAQCKTLEGSLHKIILGAQKIPDNVFMKRGRDLEPLVLKVVQQLLGLRKSIEKAGFQLHSSFPIFGASADGVTRKFVFEVKCPSTKEATKRYLDENGQPQLKFRLQILLQIMLCNRESGYFCVAHHEFEKNSLVEIVHVPRDDKLVLTYMKKAENWWCASIFPKLIQSVLPSV